MMLTFDLECMHTCVPSFEKTILEAFQKGDFNGIDIRCSRHIQDPDTKRWFFVPPHSKRANIPIEDGIHFGKLIFESRDIIT